MAALFPVSPERAAENARLLEREVAAYDEAHADEEEPGRMTTALAAVLMGWVFTALGYVANTTQTPASQTGIVLLISFIPALFAFLAVGVMMFYKLDNQTLKRIQIELAARKIN